MINTLHVLLGKSDVDTQSCCESIIKYWFFFLYQRGERKQTEARRQANANGNKKERKNTSIAAPTELSSLIPIRRQPAAVDSANADSKVGKSNGRNHQCQLRLLRPRVLRVGCVAFAVARVEPSEFKNTPIIRHKANLVPCALVAASRSTEPRHVTSGCFSFYSEASFFFTFCSDFGTFEVARSLTLAWLNLALMGGNYALCICRLRLPGSKNEW